MPVIIEPTVDVRDPDLHVAVAIARRLEPLGYFDDPEPPEPIVEGNRPEARALYWLIDRVRQIPFKELRETANDKVTATELKLRPEEYRAKPIVIRGQLRRIVRMPLDENPLGLDYVYYGQVVDADSEFHTFYCLQIPEGIRRKEGVALYGLYFKNWVYVSEARNEVTSPVIVAQRMLLLVAGKDYTTEIILGVVAIATVTVLFIGHARERARMLKAAQFRRQRELGRIPKNLNSVARQLSTVHRHSEGAEEETPEDSAREAPEDESGEQPEDG
jgi:hypothetical protein